MLTLPITFSLAPFPTGSALDADQYGQQLVANLTATFSGNFLTGQTGGTAPISDIGPWFNLGTWYTWNTALGAYAPMAPSYFYDSTILNGDMQVWQRDVTFAAVSNEQYTADRWKVQKVLSTGVATVSQSAANIPGTLLYPNTAFSCKVTVTTPQSVIAPTEVFVVSQAIEKSVARVLFDQKTSISLLIKTNVAGKFCVSIRTSDNGFSYVGECNVTSVGVFNRFVIQNIPPFPVSSNLGTLDTDTAYIFSVCLAAGTTFQGANNSWVGTEALGTVNQANLFATSNNTLEFTLVKHETGSTATPYIPLTFDQSLRACQRYFGLSYDYGLFQGSVSSANANTFVPVSTTSSVGIVKYPVPFRLAPAFPTTLNVYSVATGALATVRDLTNVDRSISALSLAGTTGFGGITHASIVTTAGNAVKFQYAASAEL